MVCDILCRNSQDGNGQVFKTFDQVSYEVKNGKVFNYSDDKFESSVIPKCICSFIFATTVLLNIICGWFGLDFSQKNKTSVACLVGSGFNSNFH